MTLRLNADLVVLSACDTAVGKDVAGEGLMGLRYVVLARGARAVVASLWDVLDEPTSELMTAFYRSVSDVASHEHRNLTSHEVSGTYAPNRETRLVLNLRILHTRHREVK
jgi:hypothetical protein